MGFFKRTKAAVALSRKAREQLYERALNELEAGIVRRGLWAQALAEGDGDESRAKGVYLKLRVQSMLDENAIVDQLVDDLERSGTPINPQEPESEPDSPAFEGREYDRQFEAWLASQNPPLTNLSADERDSYRQAWEYSLRAQGRR